MLNVSKEIIIYKMNSAIKLMLFENCIEYSD